MSRPIKIGLVLEPFEGIPARAYRWANLLALAQRAEVGRDPATLVRTAGAMVDPPGEPARDNPNSPPLAGSP